MLKINLENKMVESKRLTIKKSIKDIEAENRILESFGKIIKESEEKDLNILMESGLSSAVNNIYAKERIVKHEESLKNKLLSDERIFTYEDIKKIAISYGLRFLPSNMYVGEIPQDLPQKIREFKSKGLEQKTLTDFYGNNKYERYFILAPKESFELKEKPKDPLFFAELKDGTYYLVHKWGGDISFFNYLKNLPVRSDWSFAWFLIIVNIVIFSTLIIIKPVIVVFTLITILFSFFIFNHEISNNGFNNTNWRNSFKD